MRLLAGSGAVLCLLVATACGGGGSTEPTTPPAGQSSVPVPTTATGSVTPAPAAFATCSGAATDGAPVISMEGSHSLNPSDETTTVGGAVTWTNNSSTNHQIAFTGMAPCQFTLIGKSTSVTFSRAGSFAYVCKIHPTFMKGTITVK